MIDDTYKGESPAKKLARAAFWDKAMMNIHRHNVRGGILVLASREGGDISTLLGMGVPPGAIIGVDRCPDAAKECQDKFPEVRVICDDVCNVADYARGEVAALFLDFCGPISPNLTKIVWRCAQRACVPNAIVGVGFLRGRERIVGQGQIERARLVKEKYTEETKAFVEHGLIVDHDERDDPDAVDCVRHVAAWIDINDRARSFGWQCLPIGAVTYQSTSESSRGVPMIYGVSRKVPVPCTIEQFDYDQNVLVHIRPRIGDSMEMAVKRSAVHTAKHHGTKSAALIYNVPETTVVAWMAHETRGTYGKIPPLRYPNLPDLTTKFLGRHQR